MLQVRLPMRRASWSHTHVARFRLALGALWTPLLALGGSDEWSGPTSRLVHDESSARRAQFEQWFAQYRQPLLDYLYGMTRDREWAADLVQETFLHAYGASDDPEAISYPRAWLYRIATNTALTALRRRKRFSWLPLTAIEPPAGASSSDRWVRPETPYLTGQDFAATVVERDAVWKTLAELPPRWRSVLLLQTSGGFEVREIASQLGLSEANVRKILFRAKERFRALHAQMEAADYASQARGGPR